MPCYSNGHAAPGVELLCLAVTGEHVGHCLEACYLHTYACPLMAIASPDSLDLLSFCRVSPEDTLVVEVVCEGVTVVNDAGNPTLHEPSLPTERDSS